MWLEARSTAHEGTTPAGAMVTPFTFPCGTGFLKVQHQQDKAMIDKCAPPGFEEYWWSSAGYYSPAICPRGYTAGCMRWNSDQGPSLEPTETAVQCVPSGYVCNTIHISMAYSYSETAPMIQVRWAETDLPSFATHPLYPGANPTNHELRGLSPRITEAPNLVERQAVASGGLDSLGLSNSFDDGDSTGMDNPVTTTRPRTGSASATGTGSDDGTTGFPTFKPKQTAKPSDGLSTGAKAGIGVGVAVVVLIVLGAAAFFFWRRRKQSTGQTPPADTPRPNMPEMEPGGKYELPAGHDTASPTAVGSELGGVTPVPAASVLADKDEKAELASNPALEYGGALGWAPELQGQQRLSELYGQELASYNSEPSPDSQPAELDSAQPPVTSPSPISRKQVASPVQQQQPQATWQTLQLSTEAGPDTRVSILPANFNHATPAEPISTIEEPPAEPSAQEIAALQQQHAQLENRRQRILELEQIERDQAVLEQRINAVRGNEG